MDGALEGEAVEVRVEGLAIYRGEGSGWGGWGNGEVRVRARALVS